MVFPNLRLYQTSLQYLFKSVDWDILAQSKVSTSAHQRVLLLLFSSFSGPTQGKFSLTLPGFICHYSFLPVPNYWYKMTWTSMPAKTFSWKFLQGPPIPCIMLSWYSHASIRSKYKLTASWISVYRSSTVPDSAPILVEKKLRVSCVQTSKTKNMSPSVHHLSACTSVLLALSSCTLIYFSFLSCCLKFYLSTSKSSSYNIT